MSLSYLALALTALSSYFFLSEADSFFQMSEAFVVTSVIAKPFAMSLGRSSLRKSIHAEAALLGLFSSLGNLLAAFFLFFLNSSSVTWKSLWLFVFWYLAISAVYRVLSF